jgi:5-methylcytosine-specific restriction endonuclease McrA
MQRHIRNYLASIDADESTRIRCEVCNDLAVDIHHIIPRSKFGSKRKEEQDAPDNLIALCRTCHENAHKNLLTKDELFAISRKKY